MRLWTLHPKYLDPQGLVALWREALLARSVIRGLTQGYRHHPQLLRFQSHVAPRSAINAYYERRHLLRKLRDRCRSAYLRWRGLEDLEPHPMFEVTSGPVEQWERIHK